MPFVQIFMLEGRTEAQKKSVIEKVTVAICEAVDAPARNVRVWIQEVPASQWGIGGVPASDLGR